ncbi:hypothetical protein V1477_001488 [Vespula maculifrons]|uniref:Uncharacterized protein n=1 Tax=Vespula maculifrons TaxID=7453 RepID=A0ABD2D044_VESMC
MSIVGPSLRNKLPSLRTLTRLIWRCFRIFHSHGNVKRRNSPFSKDRRPFDVVNRTLFNGESKRNGRMFILQKD